MYKQRVKIGLLAGVVLLLQACGADPSPSAAEPKPSMTVSLVAAQESEITQSLLVNGSVAAWQEVIVGSELAGIRLAALQADLGDVVKKGQVLARFDEESVRADLAQAQAALQQARARAAEAELTARLLQQINDPGAVSQQEMAQATAAKQAAVAQVQAAQAALAQQELRLRNAVVKAPDDGVISARMATLGMVPNTGQELFRMVRRNRLEWQADVTARDLAQITVGTPVTLQAQGQTLNGKVRVVSPVVDPSSRNGRVIVDIPGAFEAGLKPGMFTQGQFMLGQRNAVLLPQSAVIEREGFHYAFTVDPQTNTAQRIKLTVGKSQGDMLEVVEGIQPGQSVVASGVAFLAHGDLLKVVQ